MKLTDETSECLTHINAGLATGASELTRQFAQVASARLANLLANGHQAASHAPKRTRKKKAAAEAGAVGGGA